MNEVYINQHLRCPTSGQCTEDCLRLGWNLIIYRKRRETLYADYRIGVGSHIQQVGGAVHSAGETPCSAATDDRDTRPSSTSNTTDFGELTTLWSSCEIPVNLLMS